MVLDEFNRKSKSSSSKHRYMCLDYSKQLDQFLYTILYIFCTILKYKIRLLRESVCYFQKAENKALTEIAFQMEMKQTKIDDTLVK